MDFKYSTLLTLRDNTRLDPVSYFKVAVERERAKERQKIINKVERCQIGVDFSAADQLEANLRFMAWKRKIFYFWYENYSDVDFEEFALDWLNQLEKEGKKRVLKKL